MARGCDPVIAVTAVLDCSRATQGHTHAWPFIPGFIVRFPLRDATTLLVSRQSCPRREPYLVLVVCVSLTGRRGMHASRQCIPHCVHCSASRSRNRVARQNTTLHARAISLNHSLGSTLARKSLEHHRRVSNFFQHARVSSPSQSRLLHSHC